jgi:hypothetical protein
MQLNWQAVIAAVISSFVIGLLWYGPLLGNAWMKEMGMAADFKPAPAQLKRSMLLMGVSALLTALVLSCAIELSRPSVPDAADDIPDAIYGLTVALGAWIGFYIPLLLSGVAWENRSWRLFFINAGYHLAALSAAAMILAHWR